jgi:hypothetical protein
VAASLGRVFDGQPGLGRAALQQRASRHFGGKTIQGHGLQVIAALTLQQRRQRHCAVMHGAFVGNVLFDADVAGLRVVEQFSLCHWRGFRPAQGATAPPTAAGWSKASRARQWRMGVSDHQGRQITCALPAKATAAVSQTNV